MLITAFRDLQWRLRRFIVAAVGTGLVFALTLVLAGLTHGFRVEAENVVDSLNIDNYLIQTAAAGPFMGSSRFPKDEAGDVARIDGVEAALPVVYGNTILQDGESPQNVNIYGIPKSAMPPIISGRAPTEPNEIAVSTTLKRAVGDEVELGAGKLQVVGLVKKSTTLAGQPNGFLTVVGAQRLMFSGQPVASAIGLRGTPATVPAGYRVVDRAGAVDDMVRPLAGAQMALSYMSVLLWGVAALIVGSLIYLSALERSRDFAVFKALGVTTWMVLSGLALQSVVVAVAAAVLGGVLAVAIGPLFPMLVAVTTSSFALLMLTAVGIGLLASLAGVRHAVAVDPVTAFGGP
ncbi:MAG: ABC transporter permease [Mycobacterium sp.]